MFKPLIRLYARVKVKSLRILTILSFTLLLSAIILHIFDSSSTLNRDKIHTERQIDELCREYDSFANDFFDSKYSDLSNLYIHNPIFERFGCNVIAFEDDDIVYSSGDISNSRRDIETMLYSDKSVVACESMVVLPIVKHRGNRRCMLVVRLADIISGEDRRISNTNIFRSPNVAISRASASGNNVELSSGEELFAISSSDDDNHLSIAEILLLSGVIVALITIRGFIFLNILDPLKSIRLFVCSFAFMLLLTLMLYITSISSYISTILSIILLAFSLISVDMMKKSIFVRHYDVVNRVVVKRAIVFTIFTLTLMLSILISRSFSAKVVVVLGDLIPITLMSMSLIASLIASNILFINLSRKKEVILLALLLIISTFTLGYFDINLSAIFLVVSFNVLIFFMSKMYSSNLKLFYAVLVVVALVCSYKIFMADTIQAFGEQFTISTNNDTHNLYDVFNLEQYQTYIYTTIEDKINWSFAIFMYLLFLFIGSGIFLLRDKLFFTGFKGTNTPENLPTIIYGSMFVIIVATTIVGKLFIKNIRQDYVESAINDRCNAICQDYKTTYKEMDKWLQHISYVFDMDIDVYNREGELLLTSDKRNIAIIPKQINNQLLAKINMCKNSELIRERCSRFSIPFSSVFILVDDSHIIRIPFSDNINTSKYSSTLTKFINIFVLVVIISLLYLAISYNRYSRPIRALKLNVGAIRLRKHILITSAMKDSYEVNYMFNEYNKMIKELEDQHQLQITIERQATWNKISRMLAHEIKNPLTPILLTSQLSLNLKKQNDPRWIDTIDDTLNTVIEQTKRISYIISEIMNESDKFNFDGSSVDLLTIFDDLRHFYAAYDNISINVENLTPYSSLKVHISHDNLWSVITNIVANAIDAIKSRGVEIGVIKFKITCNNKLATISISNNGEVIPSAYINEIFGYRFTTKKSGHGLGLFLSNHIIKMAGGDIYIKKSDRESTEFIVKLPIDEQVYDKT